VIRWERWHSISATLSALREIEYVDAHDSSQPPLYGGLMESLVRFKQENPCGIDVGRPSRAKYTFDTSSFTRKITSSRSSDKGTVTEPGLK